MKADKRAKFWKYAKIRISPESQRMTASSAKRPRKLIKNKGPQRRMVLEILSVIEWLP